ncbi:MAG: D-aminoacyl-tRNA deacylase [Actinomycetales bacterium]
MRAVVQRVLRAQVRVAGEVVGDQPGPGLLVLVGVTHSDDDATAAALADKVADLRIFGDSRDERSAADLGLGVTVVSQFTLYGDARKGRRPTWAAAAPRPVAEPLVEAVVARLVERGVPVATGRFGADMQVDLVNDGPVTILLEL